MMDYLRSVRTGLLVLAAAAGMTVFAMFALKSTKSVKASTSPSGGPSGGPSAYTTTPVFVNDSSAAPAGARTLFAAPTQAPRPTSSTLIVVPPAVPFVPTALPIIPRVPDPPKPGKPAAASTPPPKPGKPPASKPSPKPGRPAASTPPPKPGKPSKPIRQNCAPGRIPDPVNPGTCKAKTLDTANAFLRGLGGKVTIADLETMKTKFPSFKWVVVGDKVLGMDWVHPGGAALLDPYVNEPRADIKKSAWGGQYAWHLEHPTVKTLLAKNTIATIVTPKTVVENNKEGVTCRQECVSKNLPCTVRKTVCKPDVIDTVLTLDPNATVGVDVYPAWGGMLERKYGTYRSEEVVNYEKIYDVERTLGPLKMAVNRFQISIQDAEVGEDGTWRDDKGTQRGILKLLEKASDTVLVTVGFPWTAKAQKYISGGFSDGSWKAYFSRVYATLAASLAAAKTKPAFIEIFGEPDLGLWNWVYGKDPQRVYEIAKMVHDEFRKYPGFKIGGLGFACPEQNFICLPKYIDNFIDFYKAKNMKFDFWSFHAYLGWTDASDPSAYPPAPGPYNFGSRLSAFKDVLKRRGLGTATVMCTEYAWQDGDGSASWGFGDPAKSARGSMTDHRSAARTVHAIEIVRAAPYPVHLAFWAQGVGGTQAAPEGQKWGYAYNPLVVFHEGRWRYKASYYAFWMIGRVYGARLVRSTSIKNPKIGVVPTANGILLFNKSPQAQPVTLSVNGVSANRKCTMYLVDSKTFKTSQGGLDAVVSGPTDPVPPRVEGVTTLGQALKHLRILGPEATVCILFDKPIEN